MDELQELLKILEAQVNESSEKEQESNQASSPPVPPAGSSQASATPNSVADTQSATFLQRVEAFKQLGLSRFIAKYADMPNFQKLIGLILTRAEMLLNRDIQAQNVKDDYLWYLEKAREDILKEVFTATKETADYLYKTAPRQSQRKEPTYFMKDYYNDYKKMLVKSTAEGLPLDFRDGMINERGLIQTEAVGEAPLDKRPDLSNI